MTAREHHLAVRRTARFHTLGPLTGATDAWVVCHGYAQLAADFLRPFGVVDDGSRLIVAPEGLSRFYTEEAARKVGASWMTREFREADIADYVAFLDDVIVALDATLATVRSLTVLGFSQGAATACRWAARGRASPARVVLWGALPPPDLTDDDYARLTSRGTRFELVVGEEDESLTPAQVAAAADAARGRGLSVSCRTFAGGHRLESRTLRVLAGP